MPTPIKWMTDNFLFTFTSNNTVDPEILALNNGRLIVTHTSGTSPTTGSSIILDDGSNIQANGLAGGGGIITRSTSAVELSDGRFAAVWTEEPNPSGGDLRDVYAQVWYENGAGPGGFAVTDVARFLVAGGAENQLHPAIAAGTNGRFAVAYEDLTGTNSIVLKTYQQNGTILTTTTVNTTVGTFDGSALTENYRSVSILGLSNGNYVVSWQTPTLSQVLYRIFDSGGSAVTAELSFDGVGGVENFPDMTQLADGRFLIVNCGNFQAHFTIVNADGTTALGNTLIGPSSNQFSQRGTAASLPDGRFVIVWANGTDEIRGRVYFADGTTDGAEFAVATVTTGVQGRPTIDVMADGRFAVAWETSEDGNPRVKYTIFDPREGGLFTSASADSDFWQGTAFNDVALMGDGNDSFSGLLGNDVIYGEGGDDTLKGGDGNDTLIGGAGNDTLEGGIGNDNLNGNLGNDILRGGDGNDILQGEGGNDTLEGGTGDDSVNGGAGNDTLKGGDGVDLLQGEAGDDNIQAGIGNDTLFGQGGIDTMFGENGDDTLFGGDGNDTLFGQDDNDTLFGEVGNDTILGGAGNDFLFGQAGDDTLQGEAGGDFLSGELGFDQLSGGSGADTFFWNSFTQGADIVSDFNHGEGDKVMLDHTAFGVAAGLSLTLGSSFVTGANAVALQATATIIFDTATNLLWFDPDGTGAVGKQALAFLTNGGGGITAGDFIFS